MSVVYKIAANNSLPRKGENVFNSDMLVFESNDDFEKLTKQLTVFNCEENNNKTFDKKYVAEFTIEDNNISELLEYIKSNIEDEIVIGVFFADSDCLNYNEETINLEDLTAEKLLEYLNNQTIYEDGYPVQKLIIKNKSTE